MKVQNFAESGLFGQVGFWGVSCLSLAPCPRCIQSSSGDRLVEPIVPPLQKLGLPHSIWKCCHQRELHRISASVLSDTSLGSASFVTVSPESGQV